MAQKNASGATCPVCPRGRSRPEQRRPMTADAAFCATVYVCWPAPGNSAASPRSVGRTASTTRPFAGGGTCSSVSAPRSCARTCGGFSTCPTPSRSSSKTARSPSCSARWALGRGAVTTTSSRTPRHAERAGGPFRPPAPVLHRHSASPAPRSQSWFALSSRHVPGRTRTLWITGLFRLEMTSGL